MNEQILRDQPTYGIVGACAYLNMSETSLLELIGCGELAASKPSKEWVIRKSVMDIYLEKLEREQTEQRREAFAKGEKPRILTAVATVRKKRRELPKLPDLPAQAQAA